MNSLALEISPTDIFFGIWNVTWLGKKTKSFVKKEEWPANITSKHDIRIGLVGDSIDIFIIKNFA